MARDRLAALRAQQAQAGGYGSQESNPPLNNDYSSPAAALPAHARRPNPYAQQDDEGPNGVDGGEASERGGENERVTSPFSPPIPSRTPAVTAAVAAPAPANGGIGGDLQQFFGEISDIQDAIRAMKDNVDRISDLHQRSLSSIDDAQAQQAVAELEGIAEETRSLTGALKSKIKHLEVENARMKACGDLRIRKTQVETVKRTFMETIQAYQRTEQQYRAKYRQRMERQYKIVKPDATQQEIRAALEDDSGSTQVFSQALLNSNRQGEAKAALKEVQERHEDIKKIERTITELAQLFNEMSILVEQQDEALEVIETKAEEVNRDVEKGLEELDKAKTSAMAARKKRWICLVILIIAIIILVIIIFFAVKSKN